MKCPRCQSPLSKSSVGHLCPDCDGCWLTFEEMGQVLELSEQELQASDLVPTLEADHPEVQLESPVSCPLCDLPLRRFEYMLDSGVTVDSCAGHGMWLDDGELSSIREYLSSDAPTAEEDEDREVVEKVGFFRRLFG